MLFCADLTTEDTGVYTCRAFSASGTTEWTTSLAVAKPTNPNVAFYKIPSDTALPEPPIQVGVLSINATSVSLGWRRGRPGASPILGYSVQMWSPDLRGPWKSAVTRPISPPATPVGVLVAGLKPDTRYVFVVRASNLHGLSRPSEITPIVKTSSTSSEGDVSLRDLRARLAAPSLRLEAVEAVTSSSLRVRWQLLVDASLLEGIYVRYRPIRGPATSPLDGSPSSASGALSVETVYLHRRSAGDTEATATNSHFITGLRPATEYEVFVTPFFESVEGQPSSAVRSVTLESVPEEAPRALTQSVVNASAVLLTWSPIPPRLANGKVIGYLVKVSGESLLPGAVGF